MRKSTTTNAPWSSESDGLAVGAAAPPRWPGLPTMTGAVIGPGVDGVADALGVPVRCGLVRASGSGCDGVGVACTAPEEVAPFATS